MAELRRFLERFKGASDAETVWLQQLFDFVKKHLDPVEPAGPAPSVTELSLDLVRILQENSPSNTAPVSYRLISLSELGSLQRVPCVSRLSWTTNQHRGWVREAEQIPGLRPLPRVKLLLIGRLCRGRDPDLKLRDNSGEIICQLQSPLLSVRPDQFVFVPHWNFIPHDAPGRGLLELVTPPLPLCPAPLGSDDTAKGEGLKAPLSVNQALTFLLQHKNRGRGSEGCGPRGGRVSVKGVVSAVCPLLDIGGTMFFVLSLTQSSSSSVHVVVKDSSCRLWWSRSVHVGMIVHVTELRACTLRSWSGKSVLSATDQSELTVLQSESGTTHTSQSEPSVQRTDHLQLCSEAAETMDQSEAEVLAEDQSGPRRSSVISYQGTVTQVLSRGAGLYMIDNKVGLCLANQPRPMRDMRPGDVVQLSNVHLLLRPSPDHSPIMLWGCLRSSVTVMAFSPGYHGDQGEEPCPGDGVLPRLLLEKDVSVSEYLWMCHVTTQLRESLTSRGQQCVCLVSWNILQSVCPERGRVPADIYTEMMERPHSCRCSQVGSALSPPHVLSVSELRCRLLSLCWSTLRLCSLLPPNGQSLNCAQLNAALSWSRLRLQSDPRNPDQDQRPGTDLLMGERPLLLVGLLELPTEGSEAQTLHVRDSTGSVPCVVTESGLNQEQNAVFNTAWIGCLVCVRHFSMVTERFIQSEFPSFQHLDERFITSKQCRIYLQFSLDHVTVLSPSVSMTIHLHQGVGPEKMNRKKQKLQGRQEEGAGSRPCVSMVIYVLHKEGVAWRNVGAGSELIFTLRAGVIGPVVSWGWDPKNQPITVQEETPGEKKCMSLLFCGALCRWFPVLQVGCVYRVVALTQDPSILIGCSVAAQSGVELHVDSTLQVHSDWRIHSLPRPLTTLPESCDLSSLSDVINNRTDLVSFQGLILDRVGVSDQSQDSVGSSRLTPPTVRLTVCDLSGWSLQVYLDQSHAPFTPGLLPGNSLIFRHFQRRVSKSGSVYCSSVSVSCVSVVSIGQSSVPLLPPFPMMLLGQWSKGGGVSVARVKGHVVWILFLQLQWSCSTCDQVYTRSCSSSHCSSSSSVFQAKAKAVVEDGSAEAHVTFYDPLVQTLLRLDDTQWAGLQRALRVKGRVQVQPRGRGLFVGPGLDLDPLQTLLLCVCSEAQVGPVSLTCRLFRSPRSTELKRIVRGDRDFMTHMLRPLQLTCVHLERE